MRNIKKTIRLLLLTLCALFLVGWGKKSVDLLNDTPLLDLSKAIKAAPIGNQGNTSLPDGDETDKDDVLTGNPSETVSDDPSATSQEPERKTHIIAIRDTKLTYDERPCANTSILEDRIIRDCSGKSDSVYLKDDYAEAHVYSEVLEILEKLHETIGLEYVFE